MFLKKFDKSQIYKISFEKIKKNRDSEIKKLFSFLKLNDIKIIEGKEIRKNLSKISYKPDIKKIKLWKKLRSYALSVHQHLKKKF